MTGPGARDPQPGEPEYRPRWQDARRDGCACGFPSAPYVHHRADSGLACEEHGPRAGDTAPDDARDNPAWQRLIATTNAQEVARLRSENAALRDAGNALAVAAMKPHEAYWETGLPDVDALDDAARAAAAWRSAAGGPTEETDHG